MRASVVVGVALGLAACGGSGGTCDRDPCVTDDPSGADTDTDTDADSDADADADSDTDADADPHTATTTADTGPTTPAHTAVPLPLPGFGALSGDCDVLDDGEWTSSAPSFYRSTVDFGAQVFDPTLLSPGGEEIIDDGNLGGSSVESEAIAYESLYRCELAELLKTEAEVLYTDAGGKKTDELVEIDGRKVGVSVTRALTFVDPTNKCGAPSAAAIEDLLTRKLSDLPLSAANAAPADAWERSMLSIVACDAAHADLLFSVWSGLDPSVTLDAIVMVTVTDGDDAFLY